MPSQIVLLRAVNVGGRNKIPMAELREACTQAGLASVKTYIQSGNLVAEFVGEPDVLAEKVSKLISDRFKIDIAVIALDSATLRKAAQQYPFRFSDPKFAFIMFLDRTPDPESVSELLQLETGEDEIAVEGPLVFTHYPNGVSGATLQASKIEKTLRASGTARNLRTIGKLIEMSS